jgi:hypothetical protein
VEEGCLETVSVMLSTASVSRTVADFRGRESTLGSKPRKKTT